MYVCVFVLCCHHQRQTIKTEHEQNGYNVNVDDDDDNVMNDNGSICNLILFIHRHHQ